MKKNRKHFFGKLKQFRRIRQAGLLLCELIRVAGITGIILTAYVFLDYFLALSPIKLKIINSAIIATLSVYFMIKILQILRLSFPKTAKIADKASKSRRQHILGTLELLKRTKSLQKLSEMGTFLVKKLLNESNEILNTLPLSNLFPKRELKRQILTFLFQLIVVILLLGIPYRISSVVLNRIFHPSEDIPPYSRYLFAISPAKPSVIYGGTLELATKITGAPIRDTVLLRTRQGDNINSAACFKDGENRYVQRIEKLTTPVEFCFAIGRYRSKWHKMELLMLPRISLAQIDVKPPNYTHIPEKRFVLGRSSLKVLKGSDVTLTVTSNRPLSSGDMIITDKNRNHKVVKGEKTGINSLKFNWTAKGKSEISVKIRDIRNTPSEKPMIFKQLLLQDKFPSVELTEPEPFFLATPDAKFKVRGYAEDDYGIKRVDFVRNIIGYRDRMKHLGPELVSKKYDITQEFDFAKLGVQPGEVIEIYAEASDFNPSLMGLAVSDVIKIKIISREQYAEILRTRIKVDTIFRRYAAMKKAFKELKKSLQNFNKRLTDKKLSQSDKQKMLDNLKKTNTNAKRLLAKLAEDFPIYEMEKEQKKTFKALHSQTLDNESALDKMSASDPNKSLLSEIEKMLAAFKRQEKKMQEMDQQMQQLEALVKLMKSAGRYAAMLKKQEGIVRRLTRFKVGNDSGSSGMLSRLGNEEKKMSENLEKLIKEISSAADALPSKYKRVRDDSFAFLEKLKSYKIIPELNKANKSASIQRGNRAYMHGEKALEMMRRLIDKKTMADNAFSQMCRGEMPQSCSGSGSGSGGGSGGMQKTARQMRQSSLKQFGQGNGQGQGSGSGQSGRGGQSRGGAGDINDGYSMDKSSMLDLPVVGPKRSSAGNRGGKVGGTRGKGKGNSSNRKILSDAKGDISTTGQTETETESISLDDAPYKYRKAVKKYFSEEE